MAPQAAAAAATDAVELPTVAAGARVWFCAFASRLSPLFRRALQMVPRGICRAEKTARKKEVLVGFEVTEAQPS
jgi:hypothetical protein